MMTPPRVSHEQGFTLIELLASLTVLSLLGLMILAGMGGRSIAWGRMDREASAGEAVEATQALLRERIEHLWPATLYTIVPPGPDFRGTVDQMTFLAPPPTQQQPGPLRRYRLSLEVGGELVLESRSDVALDPNHWSERQVLLTGVQSLDLAYFGSALQGGGPAWRGDWLEQPFTPGLVRIRLDFPDGDRRRWPDLLIHPAADIDAGCVLEIASGRCRGR